MTLPLAGRWRGWKGLGNAAGRRGLVSLGQEALAGGSVPLDELPQGGVPPTLLRGQQARVVPPLELEQAILAEGPLEDEVETIVLLPLVPFGGDLRQARPLIGEVGEVLVDERLSGRRCYLSHCASSGMAAARLSVTW